MREGVSWQSMIALYIDVYTWSFGSYHLPGFRRLLRAHMLTLRVDCMAVNYQEAVLRRGRPVGSRLTKSRCLHNLS